VIHPISRQETNYITALSQRLTIKGWQQRYLGAIVGF
jgi:hypothetical protein